MVRASVKSKAMHYCYERPCKYLYKKFCMPVFIYLSLLIMVTLETLTKITNVQTAVKSTSLIFTDEYMIFYAKKSVIKNMNYYSLLKPVMLLFAFNFSC